MSTTPSTTPYQKPPYKLGLLGIIPLVGFFVGLGLVLYSAFRYKDRKLTYIGVAGMAWTVIVYSLLFWHLTSGPGTNAAAIEFSKTRLTTLIKNIEFYRIQHNQYPDSLEQAVTPQEAYLLLDPINAFKKENLSKFEYRNLGEHYLLFSVGADGKANTADDLYPIIDSTNNKNGWIKK